MRKSLPRTSLLRWEVLRVLWSLRLSTYPHGFNTICSGIWTPRSQWTLSLLAPRYWWPSMSQDLSWFMKGCSVCAISKVPQWLPEGKLLPFPIPHHPRSYIADDFISDLLLSDTFTCVLVVVDRLSKSCKLISLPRLPTPLKQPKPSSTRYSGIMVFQRISCREGPPIHIQSLEIVLQSAKHHLSLSWVEDSGHWEIPENILPWPPIKVGASALHGPNTLKTPFVKPPLDKPLVTCLPCAPGPRNSLTCQL